MRVTPSREEIELYVTGNFDGDIDALERAVAEDPALGAIVAEEARLESLLRDAAAAAAFCPACDELVRGERCEECGAAVKPGGYTIERVLVSNAHGRMYVARDADGTQVALKELAFVQPPSPAALEAFEREAKFLRALEHPAIPRFVASFEEGRGVHTRYYLAQELVAGTPLDRIDDHWYSEAEIVDIAKQVLAILVYLQSLSPMVIHRDIKPANLIRRADGTIALVDFGAAHMPGTTVGLTTVGTFGYMPIEQLAGIVDATTDLYALGASLLYLLTRQVPWRLERTKTTVNASAPLRAFLDKLVANDPRDRFASAKAALAALDKPAGLRVRRSWRKPIIAAAITAAVAAAGGTAAIALWPDAESPRASEVEIDKSTFAAELADKDRARRITSVVIEPWTHGDATYRIRRTVEPFVEIVHDAFPGTLPDQLQRAGIKYDVKVPPSIEIDAQMLMAELADPYAAKKIDSIEIERGPDEATYIVTRNVSDIREVVHDQYPGPILDAILRAGTKFSLRIVGPRTVQEDPATQSLKTASRYLKALIANKMRNKDIARIVIEVGAHADATYVISRKSMSDKEMIHAEYSLEVLRALLDANIPYTLESPPLATSTLHIDTLVSWDFKHMRLHDALMLAGKACGLNVIVPGYVDASVTVNLTKVPCGKAIETLLEANGLWYVHDTFANLIRIGARKDLEREPARLPSVLPPGQRIDLDLKHVPLREVLRMIATSGNKEPMNIVVPDTVTGDVTISAAGAQWQSVFEAALAAHGLWYTYRADGHLIAVAPRHDIAP